MRCSKVVYGLKNSSLLHTNQGEVTRSQQRPAHGNASVNKNKENNLVKRTFIYVCGNLWTKCTEPELAEQTQVKL